MSTPGQLTAKPPVSPHANLRAIERTGTDSGGSAIWKLACACGVTLEAAAHVIKRGKAHCPECNPRLGMQQAKKILAALPAKYAQIERKTGLTTGQVLHRIEWMRERDMCFVGKWWHAEQQGAFSPVFYAGKGEDVPCKLTRRTDLSIERRYRKRVKRAIEKALEGGKEDPRYMRHIALHKATETVKRTRTQPQNPFSALFVGSPA